MVSPKHANFIVNTGPATASDVWRLAELVRQRVREERGVELRYEVEFVGDWPEPVGDQPAADAPADPADAGLDGHRGRRRIGRGGLMSTTGSQPMGRRVALSPMAISVLFGGPSAEHDVSLVSGRSIARALLERGHDVSAWLIDREGRWWPLPRTALDPALSAADLRDPAALGATGPRTAAGALEELASHQARRLPRHARSLRRGRPGAGAARIGRPDLLRRRPGRLRRGHGQDPLQAHLRLAGAARAALAGGARPRVRG